MVQEKKPGRASNHLELKRKRSEFGEGKVAKIGGVESWREMAAQASSRQLQGDPSNLWLRAGP